MSSVGCRGGSVRCATRQPNQRNRSAERRPGAGEREPPGPARARPTRARSGAPCGAWVVLQGARKRLFGVRKCLELVWRLPTSPSQNYIMFRFKCPVVVRDATFLSPAHARDQVDIDTYFFSKKYFDLVSEYVF